MYQKIEKKRHFEFEDWENMGGIGGKRKRKEII